MLVCGGSGAGKSTLATLLLERGFRVLDDNVAALDQTGGDFRVQPGLGYLQAYRRHAEDAEDARLAGPGFAAPFETKYVHFLGPQEFCREARPLRHIFVLDRASDGSGPAHSRQR